MRECDTASGSFRLPRPFCPHYLIPSFPHIRSSPFCNSIPFLVPELATHEEDQVDEPPDP